MQNYLWMLLVGLVAGSVARYILPREVPGGILRTLLLGVSGSFLATLLGHFVGWYGPAESSGFLGAIAGSLLLLEGYVIVCRISE